MHGLINHGGIRVAKQRQKAATLPISLRQRAHHVKFYVLLQSTPPDAKNGCHAESESKRLKQKAAPHRLPGGKVRPNFLKVQRHRFTAQKSGLGSLASDRKVGTC
jgi:hypothetical protein